MEKLKIIILTVMVCAIPFLAGCFFGGNSNNPIGTPLSGLSQPPAANVAVGPIDPKILAAKYYTPTPSDKKNYTFAKGECKSSKKQKESSSGDSDRKGSKVLRLFLKKDFSDTTVFITVQGMEVQTTTGKTLTFSVPSQEINLKSSDDLNDVFSDVTLPVGTYRSFAFNISSARFVKNGKSYDLYMPSNKVVYFGKFEIKDGFTTLFTIKFAIPARFKLFKEDDDYRDRFQKIFFSGKKDDDLERVKQHWDKYLWKPAVLVSSRLVASSGSGGGSNPPPAPLGSLDGTVTDFVTKAALPGVTVTVQGTSFTATTDASGKYSIANVTPGTFNVVFTNANYLDMSFSQLVEANMAHTLDASLNPAVIKSTVGNTGWFSAAFPLADANGRYGEVAMESPVVINFASLAFVKAEVAFDGEYSDPSGGFFNSYISTAKQVTVLQDLGSWWVGNNAVLGTLLGLYNSTSPATHYSVDVTSFVQNNPNSAYFLASRNLSVSNMRLSNIVLTISYR